MYISNVLVKGRVLNILLPIVGLLLAETSLASSEQKRSTNITVIRTSGFPDSFTFKALNFENMNCSLKDPNTCALYGGIKRRSTCETKEMCCEPCQCIEERPTFLTHKQRCVEDKNITENSEVSMSGYRFILDFPDSTCRSQVLANLNTTASGKQNFSICPDSPYKITRCTMSPNESKYLDRNGNWVHFDPEKRRAIKHGFSLGVLQLKWQDNMDTLLQGSIIMLDVSCFQKFYFHTGEREVPINSRLLFKMAGSQDFSLGQDSNIFQEFDIVNPTSQSGGLVVMPTTNFVPIATDVYSSTATDDKEKLNVIHVPGKVDMILVVVAAILGTLLFITIIFACIGVAYLVMRKKKNINLGASNPLYERGPDMTLAQNRGARQTATLYNSHFYQPLIENTREVQGNRGEPIYQSLDEQVRVSKAPIEGYEENPNRCSLAYCDMTADGYLIPTDGHIIPQPPTSPVLSEGATDDSYIVVLPDKIVTEDQSLNYKYNKPEEVIPDHSPTISLREVPTEVESDQELNYDDVNVIPLRKEKEKTPCNHALENSNEEKNSNEVKNSEGEEKKHCNECKGTMGNYGTGQDLKPVRCLCDVTTKL